jgi:hypothetical protein
MTTPEGHVKAKLRRILSDYTEGMYTYWPVPSGFGKTSLDVIGCYRGLFFSVETKADKKKPTLRQTTELQNIGKAMGQTFVMSGVGDPRFNDLIQWLDQVTGSIAYDPRILPDEVRRTPL